MEKRKIIILAVAAGVIALGFLLQQVFAAQKDEPDKPRPVSVPKYVKTAPVRYSNIETAIAGYGRVQSSLPLDIVSEVRGRILPGNVPLKVGQQVKKGTLLYRVESTEARLNLQASRSNFLRDLANALPDLRLDYATAYPEWQQYFASIDVQKNLPQLPEVNDLKLKTFLATRGIFSSYYTIKSAENNLSKHYVYAPFSGNISSLQAQIGSFVNIGTPIARLSKTSDLELQVAIPLEDLKFVQKGSQVQVASEESQQVWQGQVTRISEVVNENTQSVDVFVKISDNAEQIYQGMYLRALMNGPTIERAMEIPRSAIFNRNQVYVVQNDSVLQLAEVQILKVNAETAVITGLPEYTDLVVEPLVNAYADMTVQKLEDAKQAPTELLAD
jgi:multidrug efflux pump subunit AcrA (membrane-fusion protein)